MLASEVRRARKQVGDEEEEGDRGAKRGGGSE